MRSAQGNWNGAAQSALDNAHLGIDFCKGKGISSANHAHTILRHGLRDLESIIEGLDARKARTTARELRHLMAEYPTLFQSMNNDKQSEQQELIRRFARDDWRRVMTELNGHLSSINSSRNKTFTNTRQTLKENPNKVKSFLHSLLLNKRVIMQNYNEVADAAIAAAKKPYTPFNIRGRDAYSDYCAYLYAGGILRGAKTRTTAAMIETALALRAYKLEKGSYPASLDELVPAYLPSVPQDVFASKPLRYKRDGATYKLWSIGPDGKDDGGKPARDTTKFPNRQTIVDSASIGDFVYGVNR